MTLSDLIKILRAYPNQDEEVKILAMSEIYEGLGMECDFINIVPMSFESGKEQCACIAINCKSIGNFTGFRKENLH